MFKSQSCRLCGVSRNAARISLVKFVKQEGEMKDDIDV